MSANDFLALLTEPKSWLETASGSRIDAMPANEVSASDVYALGSLLPELAFIYDPDGRVAHRVFISKEATRKHGPRGKLTVEGFSFEPSAEHDVGVVTWWKQLAGNWRSVDMGLSIRTSWGWARALREDPKALQELGTYLQLVLEEPEALRSANVFLSAAAWATTPGAGLSLARSA